MITMDKIENIKRNEKQRRAEDRRTELVAVIAVPLIFIALLLGFDVGAYVGDKNDKLKIQWLIKNRDEWQDSQEKCVSNNRTWQLSYEDAVKVNRNWATWCSDHPDEERKKLLK
jgi:hypothetical protein